MLPKLLKHYRLNLLIAIVFAVLLTILGQHFDLKSILLIISGFLISTFFLDLDFLFYSYFYNSETSLAHEIREFVKQRNWLGLVSYEAMHQDEMQTPLLRSALFQVVMLVLAAYLIISQVNLLGISLAFGIFFQSLPLGWQKRNQDWFWILRKPPTRAVLNLYFVLLLISLVYLISLL